MASSLTFEEWQSERDQLLQQIQDLELRVQQLPSEPSSSITPPSVEGILNEFYTLGLQLFEADEPEHEPESEPEYEPEEDVARTPTQTITKAFMNDTSSNLQYDDDLLHYDDDGLVKITPICKKGTKSKAIDALVKKVFDLYKPEGNLKYLQGNFAPVQEETRPTEITLIEGQIPTDLKGIMLRNGPDAQYDPEGHYSWMDGESMIHGIRFNGREKPPTYVARYTGTSRYHQQCVFKRSEFLKYGDLNGQYGVFSIFVKILRERVKVVDHTFGDSTASNNIVYHGRRIMALDDFGQPHVIYVRDNGDLETLGINRYEKKLGDDWLAPHPKKDPNTREMFSFSSRREKPYCVYRKISDEGVMTDIIDITVDKPTFMHDLCITKNYVIFQELPFVYNPEQMATNDNKWIFDFADDLRPRYGILKRNATTEDKIRWFEYTTGESFFGFHNANAWEVNKDTIVLYCCLMVESKRNDGTRYILPPEFIRYDTPRPLDFQPTYSRLYKLTFDLTDKKNKNPKKENISSEIQSGFPKINEKYMARKSRYIYVSEFDDTKVKSIVKYDVNNPTKYKQFVFGTDTFGGEVVFVPRNADDIPIPIEDEYEEEDEEEYEKGIIGEIEDDGYLLVFVHHEKPDEKDPNIDVGTSYVYVIDAKKMKKVIAKLQLPKRVPYGFHTTFVTQDELKNQKPRQRIGREAAE